MFASTFSYHVRVCTQAGKKSEPSTRYLISSSSSRFSSHGNSISFPCDKTRVIFPRPPPREQGKAEARWAQKSYPLLPRRPPAVPGSDLVLELGRERERERERMERHLARQSQTLAIIFHPKFLHTPAPGEREKERGKSWTMCV